MNIIQKKDPAGQGLLQFLDNNLKLILYKIDEVAFIQLHSLSLHFFQHQLMQALYLQL